MANPQVITDDILRSFTAWSRAEIERIKKTYGMAELAASNAVAFTVLGGCVVTLRMLGQTTEHIVAIIKGKKPS